jgi:hypothetical protein
MMLSDDMRIENRRLMSKKSQVQLLKKFLKVRIYDFLILNIKPDPVKYFSDGRQLPSQLSLGQKLMALKTVVTNALLRRF